MTKKIESANKLPEWFDLKKYEAASNLPLVDWALNLIVRNRVLSCISGDYFKPKEEAIKDYEEEIALIQTHGVLSRTHLQGQYELAKYDYDLEKLKPGFGVVYSLPLTRAVEIYEFIQWDTKLRHGLELVEYQKIFDHQRKTPLHSGEKALKDWYENFYEKAAYDEIYDDYGSFSPHVCVDLGVTDEILIEAFKSWLQLARNRKNSEGSELPEKLSSKLIKKWTDSAILPYLDLKIYEQLVGVGIPLHVIGNAIFSETVVIDTTEAVRKTTRQHAEKALIQANGILRHALIAEELNKNGIKFY